MPANLIRADGPCRLSPATPLGLAELWVRARIDRARSREIDSVRDVGASVIEWVVISATLVAIASTVGYIITQKVKAKASGLNLDGGAAPAGGAGGGNP